MIEQTTRSSDNQINTFGQLIRLCFPVRSSHHDPESLRMSLHELLRYSEDLKCKFPSWRNDDHTGTYDYQLLPRYSVMNLPLTGLNLKVLSISTLGIKKAIVLPLPVLAAPRTSFPASKGGIVLA